jgi:hypothetical protein
MKSPTAGRQFNIISKHINDHRPINTLHFEYQALRALGFHQKPLPPSTPRIDHYPATTLQPRIIHHGYAATAKGPLNKVYLLLTNDRWPN